MAGRRSRIIRRFLSASELPREGGECVSATKDGVDLVDHLKVIQVGDIAGCGRLAGRGKGVRKTLRLSLWHQHIVIQNIRNTEPLMH
jgi:hypothetical protein